jgi:two-component system, LytTR family, sensor kinase
MVYNYLLSDGSTLFLEIAMRNRFLIYWICQLTGWGLFVLGNFFFALTDDNYREYVSTLTLIILVIGISTTHLYRSFIKKWRWSSLSITQLLPRIFLASIILGVVFTLASSSITQLISHGPFRIMEIISLRIIQPTMNFSILFLIWNILYFGLHTFENWKIEEIKNLQLKAAKTEIELNSFRSQMNPHFMFNAMNSIRALVDEDPEKAKHAITLLSGILRNNLMLGKRQTVQLKEEMDLVEKYLAVEKIRFEERLEVKIEVDREVSNWEIPPFMLQTIVENGIKHGVSKRIQGGTIVISAKEIDNKLCLKVLNSGEFVPKVEHEGIGLANTIKRLELLYGNGATFNVQSGNGVVEVVFIIPKLNNLKDEDHSN